MSLLLATRLECYLNSLTVNANQMRWLFIGPSRDGPLCFSWAVSINGASEYYPDGLWISTCPTGSHSPSAVALFSAHAHVLTVLLSICLPTSLLCLSLHLVLVTHQLHDVPFTSNLLTSLQQ